MANYYTYLTATGQILPDTGTLQTDVENEFKEAFGEDLIVTPDTPQGMLIAAEVLARDSVLRNNAAIANLINPNLAGGIALDAIWALTGGARDPQTYSIVLVALQGVPGTLIPINTTLIRDPDSTAQFKNITLVTLNSNGVGAAVFQAVDPGPIAALAGSLTTIVSGPLGLETVINTEDAILGTITQSDLSSRAERRDTLALQGMSLAEAIESALYKVQGVISLKFRENYTGSTAVIDGVTMVAHSIYVCIDGGLDLEIATTMQAKKTGGTAYNNGPGIPVSVNVTVPVSGQVIPVLFDRPILKPVVAKVYLRVNNSPVNVQLAVKKAILDYANGLLEGEDGFTIGNSVSSFELASAVNREVPSLYVKEVKISLASVIDYTTAEIPIAIFEKATIVSSSIEVILV